MQFSYSQEKTIKGIVSDSKGSISGANIVVKGTKISTQSDFDGSYSIKAKVGDILVFSFIGMDQLTRKIEASTTTVNMTMRNSTENTLGEVVVTGQGIKKSKKALGFAQTTIKAEELASKPSTDVARALTGKAAGVNIAQTSGLSGSGTNVIIRGYSSITGSNQPLFVVDGVPFNTDTNSDGNFLEGATNASSRFLDIDPNSIASMSILKGLAATTLYGQAGRSGVILITTKSGDTKSINKKMEVSYSNSLYFTKIASLPQYQDTYGNGFDNNYGEFFSNWGPRFDSRNENGIDSNGSVPHPYAEYGPKVFPQYFDADNLPINVPYAPQNNVKPFFTTGTILTHSLNVGGRSENTSYNVSAGNTDDQGFVENNFYRRLNLSVGGSTKLANGLTFSSVANYVRTDKSAPPSGASFGSGTVNGTESAFANILYTPRNFDLFRWEFTNPLTQGSVNYRPDITNPRWLLKNSGDKEAVRRFFGNFKVNYAVNSWSNLTYTLAIDNYTQRKDYYVNRGGSKAPLGFLTTSNRENTIFDHTLAYNFNKEINKRFTIDGVLGFNPRREFSVFNRIESSNQFLFGLNYHDNFVNSKGYSGSSEFNIVGLFGSATIAYDKYLYLNLQGRRDEFSSLTKENRALFYPSVSLSFVPTDAFEILKNNNYVNFLKFRLSSGSSAGFPRPYQTRTVLRIDSNLFNDGAQIVQGISSAFSIGNVNLKPELVKELEFGVEGKFFKNRFGIDLSLYDKRSTENIIDRPLAPEIGASNRGDNIAEVSNKGIELALNGKILKSLKDGFNWDVTVNYTRNRNIIESLGGGVDNVYIDGFSNLGNFAFPGMPYGVMVGSKIQRDANGNYVVGADGNYIVNNDENNIIGDPNPDWKGTVINEFNYKGFTFAFQFEYQKGGDIYSTTAASLLSRGLTEDTNFDRSQSIVLPGVNENGNVNTTQINATSFGFNNTGFVIREQAVYDATNLRLREVSLTYKFSKKILDKTPFGSMSISIVGQNMWFKAFNFPKYLNFDPEVMSLGVGNGQGFDYLTGPTAKRFGFNFNLTF